MTAKYRLRGEVEVRRGGELQEVLDGLEEMLDADDPAVTTWDLDAAGSPGLVRVEVDYAGEQSGSGIDHVRGLLGRLGALAPAGAHFREGVDEDDEDRYVGPPGGEAAARSRKALAAIRGGIPELVGEDRRAVVEEVLAWWRGESVAAAGPGA